PAESLGRLTDRGCAGFRVDDVTLDGQRALTGFAHRVVEARPAPRQQRDLRAALGEAAADAPSQPARSPHDHGAHQSSKVPAGQPPRVRSENYQKSYSRRALSSPI